jgi:hypothetical protein
MILQSVITCPECGTAKLETMPTDACQFFYVCTGCGIKLRPNSGDCCVFCSYGSVACPPMQAENSTSCCSMTAIETSRDWLASTSSTLLA